MAGHRRKHACELAGLDTMPVIVRDLDNDAAIIFMVDSNIQRENILPIEKAKALKMKLEAIRRKAGRPSKENGAQVGHNLDGRKSVEIVAEQAGESKTQVQRYVRLTELSPELQQMLPSILRGHGNIEPPSNPDVPGPVATDEDSQPSVEPSQSSADRNIIINWDNVAVNESEDVAPRATRCPVDPSLYDTESWGEDEIVSYYGWNQAPAYIPDDLAGGNKPWGFMCKEKATGKIVEDEGGRRFLVDEATESSDRGFTIYASRSGILHCYLLPVDEEQTTDFGGVPVTLSHASVSYGPFDPEKMDPSGLYHLPAGYYDAYEASFTINGVEYEIEAQRLELEEVVKIVASIINVPYSENFTVGNTQNLLDKDNAASEPS